MGNNLCVVFLKCEKHKLKIVTFLGEDCEQSTSWKTKTQEKTWLSQVFSFSYLTTQLWHGANLQKGFSQNLLDARGREREEAGTTAGHWMFHYAWCCFPPKALSKVSERREPRPEMFKPLVTTWSKAALHFLIFALKWEPLHRYCVWAQWCFLFHLISPCMLKKCFAQGGRDTVRKGAIFLGW